MTTQQKTNEAIIMMALFKCSVEHSTHLIGTFTQRPKQDFNLWQNQGFKMMDYFERTIPDFSKQVEKVTDAIHMIISESKKEAGHEGV